jgi:predicted dehydrogenase
MDRRDFLKTTAAGAAGLWLGGNAFAAQSEPKTRYAIVGTGGRHGMYRDAILKTYASTSELVALCDVNEGRLRLSQAKGKAMTGLDVPLYLAADFDRMIAERKPDVVIVTTVDVFHHQYIVRAL